MVFSVVPSRPVLDPLLEHFGVVFPHEFVEEFVVVLLGDFDPSDVVPELVGIFPAEFVEDPCDPSREQVVPVLAGSLVPAAEELAGEFPPPEVVPGFRSRFGQGGIVLGFPPDHPFPEAADLLFVPVPYFLSLEPGRPAGGALHDLLPGDAVVVLVFHVVMYAGWLKIVGRESRMRQGGFLAPVGGIGWKIGPGSARYATGGFLAPGSGDAAEHWVPVSRILLPQYFHGGVPWGFGTLAPPPAGVLP